MSDNETDNVNNLITETTMCDFMEFLQIYILFMSNRWLSQLTSHICIAMPYLLEDLISKKTEPSRNTISCEASVYHDLITLWVLLFKSVNSETSCSCRHYATHFTYDKVSK